MASTCFWFVPLNKDGDKTKDWCFIFLVVFKNKMTALFQITDA